MALDVKFETIAFDQLQAWNTIDRKLFSKVLRLIQETKRSPFEGTGKPEPLKHDKAGLWSRRINQEHRLVYEVENDTLVIVSCMYHYSK